MPNIEQNVGCSAERDRRLYERIVKRTHQWQGRIFSVDTLEVELFDGSHGYREIVNHRGGAGVVAVIDGRVCLVRQYRVALGRMTLEIPAGKIDGDETGAACAARELSEETGLAAEELVPLGVAEGSPGFTNEHTEIFLAKGLSLKDGHPDEGEYISLGWPRRGDRGRPHGKAARCEDLPRTSARARIAIEWQSTGSLSSAG